MNSYKKEFNSFAKEYALVEASSVKSGSNVLSPGLG
jgi:hypothetical protein